MNLKPEEIDHINIVNWFHHEFPELGEDFHHFANERRCSPQEGMKLKRMGVKRGVLDFHLAISMNGFYGLWIELKVGNGKLSKEQIAFIERKTKRNYLALAVWGKEAAQLVILTYLRDYINDRNKAG